MERLSENFKRSEFKCTCGSCDRDAVDYTLLLVLERLRTYLDRRITITSGNRCPAYNKEVGGSETSKHLASKAADIQVHSMEPEDVYALLDRWYPDTFGIGLYSNWVHIDVRDNKVRWKK